MDKYVIAPPSGSTQNSVGAEDRPWHEGHFDSVKLNGGNLGGYLAESTGYGIVSGCEPSISGLTVTVGAGVVHLADGTRKEIAETNITLEAADPTNPRIDLVYIDSTGTVAKVTGTAAASPSAPSVPANGISVCTVSVAAGATTGTVTDKRKFAFQAEDKVFFYFPKYVGTLNSGNRGDCEIIKTRNKVLMIDAHSSNVNQTNYIVDYMIKHGITKVDYFLLTHYHGDHFGGIQTLLAQSKVDFSETKWLIPVGVSTTQENYENSVAKVQGWLENEDVTIINSDRTLYLEDTVRVELFNASDASRTYYAQYKDTTSAPYNLYSINALVYHGNVKVYYSGDSWGAGFGYLLNNYDLPNVDLYKINHHGEVEGVQAGFDSETTRADMCAYVRRLSPKYSVYNSDQVGMDPSGERMLPFVSQMFGEVYQQIEDVDFVSDGVLLNKISNNQTRQTSKTNDATVIYIDSSYDYSQGLPIGTQDKPFKSLKDANNYIGKLNSKIELRFAAGSYEFYLYNISSMVNVYSDENTLFTMGGIYGCLNVTFKNDVTFKGKLTVNQSVVRIDGNITYQDYTITDWALVINNGAYVTITGNLTIDANNDSAVGVVYAEHCHAYIRRLYASNMAKAVFAVGQDAYVMLQHLYVDKSTTNIISQDSNVFNLFVSEQHFTNISTYATALTRRFINSESTRKHYGATTDRPVVTYLPAGHFYYDTTLKKLLVSNGSAWVDTTTGNTVS